MKTLQFAFLFILSSVIAQNSEDDNGETVATLYFDEVLIYSYKTLNSEGEFWIYHNRETGNMLYEPNDEMVDFVIADRFGTYYIFGDNGHNEKTVSSQTPIFLEEEGSEAQKSLPESNNFVEFVQLSEKRILDQSTISQPSIESIGYTMHYKKMIGQQNVFITEAIPVNANLIYGFNRLNGDVILPVSELNFLGLFNPHQVVTHIERDNFMLKLENYGPNPYWAQVGKYSYYVQSEAGSWIKKDLPLLNSE